MTDQGAGRIHGILLVPGPTHDRLNARQLVDYREHRRDLIEWMWHVGKNPKKAEGYAPDVVRRRAHDLDYFYRYVWDNHTEGYTTAITTEHANAYLKQLAYSDVSQSHRSNTFKSLLMLFRWRNIEWEPSMTFHRSEATQPSEFLTRQERSQIREAALEWASIPAYHALSPEKRQQ